MTAQDIVKLKQSLGSSNKPLFVIKQCKKCKGTERIANHHVTYVPEKIVPLCSKCHAKITSLNTAAAIATGVSKDSDPVECNKIRVKLWKWFLRKKKFITITAVTEFLGVEHEFTDDQIEYIINAGSRCL